LKKERVICRCIRSSLKGIVAGNYVNAIRQKRPVAEHSMMNKQGNWQT